MLVILCLLFTGCKGQNTTVMIGNVNLPNYMAQLEGEWVSNDNSSASYNKIVFTTSDNSYNISITDKNNVVNNEIISDIVANDDYMKSYSIYIDNQIKYNFYMTDSNNIVFCDGNFTRIDPYFDQCFSEIEGAWTNESGIKVTFFTNKGTRYVNLMDGYGTFNKRIFDIDKAIDKESGNYIMTKEGANFIDFFYDINSDGSLSFYDYTLYRNTDTSELETFENEDTIIDTSSASEDNQQTDFGNKSGYEVADYSGDIPSDTAYIFVGDSRFVGMNTACGISSKSNQFVVAKISQGYYWLTNEAMDQVDEIISNHSASGWVVIFGLGINDLGNKSKYLNFYKGLADKPYKVVMVSVNPVGNYPTISNETVEAFNDSLKGLGYTYVDTYSYLMNERGYSTGDGLHYSNSTYKDIYKDIIYTIKGISLSAADREAIDNQYHGSTSNNSASNNTVSENGENTDNAKTFSSVEEFYKDENNSVAFSNKIQTLKANCEGVFSNIAVTVNGNSITYNYYYSVDVPDVNWSATDNQLKSDAITEAQHIRNNGNITDSITIGFVYYDKEENIVHSYSTTIQ